MDMRFGAIWSMEDVDMQAEGYTGLESIWDIDAHGKVHRVALKGTRAVDLLVATDELMGLTGDSHHCYLEGIDADGKVRMGS